MLLGFLTLLPIGYFMFFMAVIMSLVINSRASMVDQINAGLNTSS